MNTQNTSNTSGDQASKQNTEKTTQPSLFGSNPGGLFGNSNSGASPLFNFNQKTTNQSQSNLFSTPSTQSQPNTNIFGLTGTKTSDIDKKPEQNANQTSDSTKATSNLFSFGGKTPSQTTGGLFGDAKKDPQTTSLFTSTPTLFGSAPAQKSETTNLFSKSNENSQEKKSEEASKSNLFPSFGKQETKKDESNKTPESIPNTQNKETDSTSTPATTEKSTLFFGLSTKDQATDKKPEPAKTLFGTQAEPKVTTPTTGKSGLFSGFSLSGTSTDKKEPESHIQKSEDKASTNISADSDKKSLFPTFGENTQPGASSLFQKNETPTGNNLFGLTSKSNEKPTLGAQNNEKEISQQNNPPEKAEKNEPQTSRPVLSQTKIQSQTSETAVNVDIEVENKGVDTEDLAQIERDTKKRISQKLKDIFEAEGVSEKEVEDRTRRLTNLLDRRTAHRDVSDDESVTDFFEELEDKLRDEKTFDLPRERSAALAKLHEYRRSREEKFNAKLRQHLKALIEVYQAGTLDEKNLATLKAIIDDLENDLDENENLCEEEKGTESLANNILADLYKEKLLKKKEESKNLERKLSKSGSAFIEDLTKRENELKGHRRRVSQLEMDLKFLGDEKASL